MSYKNTDNNMLMGFVPNIRDLSGIQEAISIGNW